MNVKGHWSLESASQEFFLPGLKALEKRFQELNEPAPIAAPETKCGGIPTHKAMKPLPGLNGTSNCLNAPFAAPSY